MKHVNFKYLLSVALLSVFSFVAQIHSASNTWRFCNAGSTPVTTGPIYADASNPDPVTVQPGQSYDFTTGHTIKGICYSPNASDVKSCKPNSSFFHSAALNTSATFTLSNSSGSWNYTTATGAVACPVPPAPPAATPPPVTAPTPPAPAPSAPPVTTPPPITAPTPPAPTPSVPPAVTPPMSVPTGPKPTHSAPTSPIPGVASIPGGL